MYYIKSPRPEQPHFSRKRASSHNMMNVAPNVGSGSVCSSGRFSSSSRFSRRSSAGAASGAASLDRSVRRRDVIRPMNITTTTTAAGGSSGSAMAAVELLPLGSGGDSGDSRNDPEKSTLAGIVSSVYRGLLLRDRRTAVSKVDEEEQKGETTTTAMPSLVTPPRDQQKLQQLQNRRPAIPSRTGRDPDEIVRGKLRSELLTRRRSGTGLDDDGGGDSGTNNVTIVTAAGADDPPGEEPSIFPIVKLDIIGSAVRGALPSSTTAMVLRRRRDAEPSTIDDAELFESSETSFGISSDSLDLSKDDFDCSSSSNNNNNRRRRSISSHHRNSNVNVVRWVDTKNINNIAEVDVRVLKRYANSFVMARVQKDEDEMATTTTTIRGIDPDEDIVFSSSSSASSSALDRHQPTTTTTTTNNNNNIVNEEEVQTIITNSRLRIATISCGFKRSNYFVREDLDTRIYFSSIEDALGYMSVRGYSKMFGEEELEWRELFRRAHGVVKVSTQLCRERFCDNFCIMSYIYLI